MNSFKEDWFQCMLELIEKVESNAMETEEYLKADRQWALTKDKLLSLIPEEKRADAEKLIGLMDEPSMEKYNTVMKATVLAVEFKDFGR